MAGEQRRMPDEAHEPARQPAPKRSRARRPGAKRAPFADWRVEACLVSPQWRLLGRPAQMVVTRVSSEGAVASGVFVVDLGCLGVKDAGVLRHTSLAAWREQLREPLVREQGYAPIALDLAARIVRDGVAYARRLGFEPHPSLAEAEALLAGADPDAAAPVPQGRSGAPFFVGGPHDDARAIIAQLERAVGPGRFRVLLLGSTLGPRAS